MYSLHNSRYLLKACCDLSPWSPGKSPLESGNPSKNAQATQVGEVSQFAIYPVDSRILGQVSRIPKPSWMTLPPSVSKLGRT